MPSDRADVVIFGATGYTGQYVVEHAARAAKRGGGDPFTLAVAGRSEDKLRKVLSQAAAATGIPELEKETEVIVADVADQDSLERMAARGRVVLNCVGPYRFYGEQVRVAQEAGGCFGNAVCIAV